MTASDGPVTRSKWFRGDVSEFLRYLGESKGLSANTIAAYGNDLSQFGKFLDDRGEASWLVEPTTVASFLERLIQREYEPSSQARKLAAVKAMYRYLVGAGKVGDDPSKDIGGARVAKRRPTVISVDEVDCLLEAARSSRTAEGYRDSAMLELLYATGMRVSELVALNLEDADFDGGVVTCCRGGSRERRVPFGPRVQQALRAYVYGPRRTLGKAESERALFLNHRGRRLTRQGFWLIIKGHAREAGIETPITPHTLRHSFATHRLRSDSSIPEVQSLLGHASPATTQIYVELAREKSAGALHPALPGSRPTRPQ